MVAHSSPKLPDFLLDLPVDVISHVFYRVKVWGLSGPLQEPDIVLLKLLHGATELVFGVGILLVDAMREHICICELN